MKSRTLPLLKHLTPLEKRVIAAARRGTWTQPDTVLPMKELLVADSRDVRVRAELIRELLMGHRGELDLHPLGIRGVRIVGLLDLDHIVSVTGLRLNECALPDGMNAAHAQLGTLSLSDSHVSGLDAENLRTEGSVFLRHSTVSGTSEFGAVRVTGALIGGVLDLDGAVITNDRGPALHADVLRTEQHMWLRDATMTGSDDLGAVRLHGAQLGGQLGLDGSMITNDRRPALHAERLRTSDIFMNNTTMTGNSELGAVRLTGAQLRGHLELDDAVLSNDSGPALDAEDLHSDDVYLRDTTVTGAGERGAVLLIGARIDGQMQLNGSRIEDKSRRLIRLNEVKVTGTLSLPASVVCPNGRTDTPLRGCPDSERKIDIDGLAFSRLADVSWEQWLHLLTHHTFTYLPQPYQQLAAVERAAGHDNNARHILITQQDDLRRRAPESLGGRLAQARHWLWGWLGRYGYRAHRLVIALTLVLTLAIGVGMIAGHVPTRPGHHAAERVPPAITPTTTAGVPCSPVELIGLGLDRGLPLGPTGLRTRCDFDTATGWGQTFIVAIWTLQALVWALATLTIAAYTGLVRKPS